MKLDHDAILKAYKGIVVFIKDDKGAFDSNGNAVELDQTKIDEARAAIDAEYATLEYSRKRSEEYASLYEQLDMQYWDTVNGTTTWKDHIAAVKAKYPKP